MKPARSKQKFLVASKRSSRNGSPAFQTWRGSSVAIPAAAFLPENFAPGGALMTKNRIYNLFAVAMHCGRAARVTGTHRPKAPWQRRGILGNLKAGRRTYVTFLLCLTTAIASPAQTFTTLHSFKFT